MPEKKLTLVYRCEGGALIVAPAVLTVGKDSGKLVQAITDPHNIRKTARLVRDGRKGLHKAIKTAREVFEAKICERCGERCKYGCRVK